MTNKICPKCNSEFKYPSSLKTHFRKSYHCLLNEEEIYNFFNKKPFNDKQCDKCNKIFCQKSVMLRHKRETKCCSTKLLSNKDNFANQNVDIINILNKIPTHLAKNLLELIVNKNNNTTNNTTNNNTINNINNNNNNTNNLIQNNINNINNNNNTNNLIQNNITIQHISPFGFEDVRKIPIPEMKRILKSGLKSGLLIIKAIYSQIENKNFYKPNMGKSDIACLNDSFDLTIYKGNQFADVLFDRCISLLHHMLYLCKTELSTIEIQLIYDNIEYIETSMRIEIYEKNLQNIIESEVRNNNANNKSSISKYVKHIKTITEVKSNANNVLNNVKQLNNNVAKDLQISITDEVFNEVLGDPKLYFNLTKDNHNYEFQMKQYQDTKFYSYWQNRLKEEKDYIENKEDKTIGDIVNIYKREEFIKMKLDVVGDRHKFLQHGETINLDVKSDHYTSKPNDDISLYVDSD